MKDFEDALLDIAWKNLDAENQRYKDIDTKATGIITICALLVSILVGFRGEGGSSLLFILTVIAFLITVFLSVIAIRTRYAKALSTNKLIDKILQETDGHPKRIMIGTIANTEHKLREVCNKKADELTYSI